MWLYLNFTLMMCLTFAVLGSLSALGSLQSAATAKQQSEKEVAIKQQIKQAQLQRIEELKKKREKLKELLQTAAAEADELHAVEENGSGSELRRAEAYCKKLREQLNVYKLTGMQPEGYFCGT